ncbi:hypothetical protein BRADI_3g55380v3 [Brachypodium distachyon]|uniref:Uncharacterized protein n=1 Tax=Brachypodium distachyon TaxID=15368 RepID=I1IDX3_BRADI|nr:hypothetical protein BRADI_3g55380v3 [Brachypodium distachyon]
MAAALFRQTMTRALFRGGKASPAAPPPAASRPSALSSGKISKGATDLLSRCDELRAEAARAWQEEWNRAASRFGFLKAAVVMTMLSGIAFAYRPHHAE